MPKLYYFSPLNCVHNIHAFTAAKLSCFFCIHHFSNSIDISISVSTSSNITEEKSNLTSGSSMISNSTNHYSIDTFPTNSRAQCQLTCAAECLTRDQCTGYNCNNEICSLFSSNCSSADNSTAVFIFRERLSITAGMSSYKINWIGLTSQREDSLLTNWNSETFTRFSRLRCIKPSLIFCCFGFLSICSAEKFLQTLKYLFNAQKPQ